MLNYTTHLFHQEMVKKYRERDTLIKHRGEKSHESGKKKKKRGQTSVVLLTPASTEQNSEQPLDMLWTLTCVRVEKLALFALTIFITVALSHLHTEPRAESNKFMPVLCV